MVKIPDRNRIQKKPAERRAVKPKKATAAPPPPPVNGPAIAAPAGPHDFIFQYHTAGVPAVVTVGVQGLTSVREALGAAFVATQDCADWLREKLGFPQMPEGVPS